MKWEEVETVAMLGTDRVSTPASLEKGLQTLGLEVISSRSSGGFLQALAVIHKLRQGQGNVSQFEGVFPTLRAEPKGNVIPQASIHHLQWILNGRYASALEEFVGLLIQENWVLPMQVWPELFNQCLVQPMLFDQIKPLVTERVEWLQQLHPDWRTLYHDLSPDNWTLAAPRELQNWWFQYRKRNPIQAITLLNENWETLNGADQKALLQGVFIGLTVDDITPLRQIQTKAKRPQSKEIQRLLCFIPESEVQQMLQGELEMFISFSQSGMPQLSLPSSFPNLLESFGVSRKRTYAKGWGQKANWLFQVFSMVNPCFWEEALAWPPSEILSVWTGSEWRKVLFNALLKASIQFKDPKWLLAIGNWMVSKQYKDLWLEKLQEEYVYAVSGELMNQVAIHYLDKHPYMLDDQHIMTTLLLKSPHPWSDAVTKHILGHLLDYLGGLLDFSPNIWHYKKLLKLAAYRANPYLHDQLKVQWEGQEQPFGAWNKSLENFFRILQFRKSMRAALELKS